MGESIWARPSDGSLLGTQDDPVKALDGGRMDCAEARGQLSTCGIVIHELCVTNGSGSARAKSEVCLGHLGRATTMRSMKTRIRQLEGLQEPKLMADLIPKKQDAV